MRTICDVCDHAPAILFCAADEAALCQSCDDKVHRCNKLASRHVRVGLADPSEVPRCDICENAPAFFYCGIDGSSLCLQCDMMVHVGGKRTHGRYLMLRQRVEFPGDNKPAAAEIVEVDEANVNTNANDSARVLPKMIDLNSRPRCSHGKISNAHTLKINKNDAAAANAAGIPKKQLSLLQLSKETERTEAHVQ